MTRTQRDEPVATENHVAVLVVKDTPILFSGPMVRAIREDRKTMTRRTRGLDKINRSPNEWEFITINGLGNFVFHNLTTDAYIEIRCPYGDAEDHLWVCETFYIDLLGYSERERLPKERPQEITDDFIYYRADGECCEQIPECACAEVGKVSWRRSIFMPRWASRLKLQIESICVERLQEISEDDARAEGMQQSFSKRRPDRRLTTPKCYGALSNLFATGWNTLNAKRGFGWDVNPWVWVIAFCKRRGSAPTAGLLEPGQTSHSGSATITLK